MKISIFGCGWLGFPLAKRLIKNGNQIKGSTTSMHKMETLSREGINPFLLSLNDHKDKFERYLQSKILIINIPSKDIEGFRRLSLLIESSSVEKVLFISSTSVYPFDNRVVTEESETNESPLVAIEELFRRGTTHQTTILRFAGLFGYKRKPGKWFPQGKKVPNPDANVNMIHQDDCIGLIEGIINQEKWGEVFNGCADTHPTKREFYSKARSVIGLQPPNFAETETTQFKIVSNEKIKKTLDYQFKYPDVLDLENIP